MSPVVDRLIEEVLQMSVRVLLADPDQPLLSRYQDFLGQLGFEVETATTGVDCVDKLRQFSPNLLVLEPELPWGWGEGVLSVLGDECREPRIPVLVLAKQKERGEKLLRAGYRISATEVKPLEPYFLANRILRILLKETQLPRSPDRLVAVGS
jgi:two-component system alkaline phosphatase synthesis response regulator PhoP